MNKSKIFLLCQSENKRQKEKIKQTNKKSTLIFLQFGPAKKCLQCLLCSNYWYTMTFLLKLKIKSRLFAVIKAAVSKYPLSEKKKKKCTAGGIPSNFPGLWCSFCSSTSGVKAAQHPPCAWDWRKILYTSIQINKKKCKNKKYILKKTPSLLLTSSLPFLPPKFCKTSSIW